MAKLRTSDGKLNVIGKRITELRQSMDLSQNDLARLLQLQGWSVHKNAISKIELGMRMVSDMELILLARVLKTAVSDLLCNEMDEEFDESV